MASKINLSMRPSPDNRRLTLEQVIPTTLIALTLDNALSLCDGMNRRLGHDRDSWIAFAARVRGVTGPH